MTNDHTVDRSGQQVAVGAQVRVLRIAPSVLNDLPLAEVQHLEAMVGQVFEVYEIDEWGQAWVQTFWDPPRDECWGHSLGLDPDEMEVA
jgi:hypothetical protein